MPKLLVGNVFVVVAPACWSTMPRPTGVTCPADQGRTVDNTTYTLFEWVGNSYIFNFGGLPEFEAGHGLDGVSVIALTHPSQTVVFACGVMSYPATETKGWHRSNPAGNIFFADRHVSFYQARGATNLVW